MRTLTVTGHGTASAVPDTAVVRVGAGHRARTPAEALTGAESARAAVVAAAGDRLVTTLDLSVWTAHDHQGRPAGFDARHGLSITARSVDDAGSLLTTLVEEIGERLSVEGVQLVVSDPAPALLASREAAYADARARAEHLASLAGATLGQIESVVDGVAAPPLLGGRDMAVAVAAKVDLQPGETTLTAAVTVTWSLA